MTRTSDSNPTGVRAYDHGLLAGLPEYRALAQAADNFVKALRRGQVPITQELFLTLVTDMAAGLGYADCCTHCRNAQTPGGLDPHFPHRVVLNGRWIRAGYACPAGHTWTCGWSIDAPAMFGGAA